MLFIQLIRHTPHNSECLTHSGPHLLNLLPRFIAPNSSRPHRSSLALLKPDPARSRPCSIIVSTTSELTILLRLLLEKTLQKYSSDVRGMECREVECCQTTDSTARSSLDLSMTDVSTLLLCSCRSLVFPTHLQISDLIDSLFFQVSDFPLEPHRPSRDCYRHTVFHSSRKKHVMSLGRVGIGIEFAVCFFGLF